ncbi:translation initiation factor IF-2 [Treponema brennaborense]|uniref:Translation initiation factor IF-2 n=1 Tax=Treponema brennaborense (strain DSM 12168 / CIP 105900 / DD5/3) TaxID=906968 RepID=F4LJE3_TREBD|nr:translation initiation factor IF-2 [Treponema brennaborense]AEE17388.1 translation initiation factor IF-2 [Treponema brennaborense DSM 12168]
MADEVENKPKFILNKQKSDPQPSGASPNPSAEPAKVVVHKQSAVDADKAPEKKKVVVVKKKVVVTAAPAAAAKGDGPKPAVKPIPSSAPAAAPAAARPGSDSVRKDKPAPQGQDAAPRAEQKPRQNAPFELSPSRPNVKAGNLSDKPRNNNYRGGRDGGGYGQRREGGFTGAQAREGYQNRGQGGYNRGPGQGNPGGQGGYNRGPGQGAQGGPGGYNRGPGQGGPGGYNRGPGQGGQGGYNRGPGQGGPGGYSRGPGQGGPGGYNRGPGGYNRGPGQGGRPGFGGAPSTPIEEAKKVPAKKTFKAKKPVYSRRDREEEFRDKLFGQKKKQSTMANPVPQSIEIMETVSVSDLAKKMNLKASDIIAKLMSMGMMVSITQSIDADTATLVASEYGCDVHIVSLYDETVIESDTGSDAGEQPRPPVVTIMGHVDHGKTKTLDAIRSAHVAEGEFGGITQHIGAYMVETAKGRITFLDTPGHEAFTMMRARGAKITDIVVLVVAADDGVMPQTVEAINHAKDAKVPIIVAVNKIDKPEANPDRVKTQLSDLGLIPEDWGGDTQFVHISALKKEGLDNLLDAILLQAEVLELQATRDCRAEGKIVESRVDHGRGVVSTVIIERGTLRTGDPFVAGIYSGRVRAIFNDVGQKIDEATPSMPVEILGMESMPNAGDPFQVTDTEKTARSISAKRQELKRFEDAKSVKKVTLDNLYDTIDAGEVMELKVIIKADVQGSAEALKSSLEKLSTKDIRLVVIHSSAGAINESDVMLAAADSNAIIVGFNVRPTPKAKLIADQEKVDIRKYNVIYKAVEEITLAMEGMLKPDVKEEVIGTVEVRDTFRVPKIGTIAGSYVLQGTVKRTSSVNVIREGIVVYTGKISSLKRFKDDVKEVAAGYECGIGVDSWHDIQVGDQFEVFEFVEVARKLGDPISNAKTAADSGAGE